MKEWFLARGYPEIDVNNQIDKFVFGRHQSVKKNLQSGIPFVTTYPPKVEELGKMIRDLLPFLYNYGEVLTSSDCILQKCKKIKDYIVRSKFYPVERNVGC